MLRLQQLTLTLTRPNALLHPPCELLASPLSVEQRQVRPVCECGGGDRSWISFSQSDPPSGSANVYL